MAIPDGASFLRSVFRKAYVFLRRQKWEEILIFLCFLLLSAGFWYLESLQEDYEISISMPVRYKNVPTDVILADNNPKEISARIKDKGTILINYLWFNSFSPVEVDMKDLLNEHSKDVVVEKRTLESAVSRQLISSTSLLNIEPAAIAINYTALIHKEIPIQANVNLLTETGFQLSDAISVNPDKAIVYGNHETIDSLAAVETELVELKKVNKTVTVTAKLKHIANVQIEPDKVTLTIPVEEFTEKRFTIPVTCSNLPVNYNLRVFPASVEVVCNIPLSKYKDLNASDLEINLPFTDFDMHRSSTGMPVRLTKQPAWLNTPLINPGSVEFILEQKIP